MPTRDRPKIYSQINVTPLIDVCLVLLIAFMVVAPILVSGPQVNLPKTADPKRITPAPNQFPIVVLFDRPPQILFGPDFRWVRSDQFRAEATALHEADPKSTDCPAGRPQARLRRRQGSHANAPRRGLSERRPDRGEGKHFRPG